MTWAEITGWALIGVASAGTVAWNVAVTRRRPRAPRASLADLLRDELAGPEGLPGGPERHPHPEIVPCGTCGQLAGRPCRDERGRIRPLGHEVRHAMACAATREQERAMFGDVLAAGEGAGS